MRGLSEGPIALTTIFLLAVPLARMKPPMRTSLPVSARARVEILRSVSPLGVGVGVADGLGVGVMLGSGVALGVGVMDGVGVMLGVGGMLGVGVTEGVGVALGVGLIVALGDGVGVRLGVGVTVCAADLDPIEIAPTNRTTRTQRCTQRTLIDSEPR
jgi:hypothetical protein